MPIWLKSLKIAFIIPAFNEEGAIGKTIQSAFLSIPECKVFVCDNNSTDLTCQEAIANGAKVITEMRKGKGFAVRRLIKYVEADIYIMVDGDNTYDLTFLRDAIKDLIENDIDMMTGNRFANKKASYMRKGHRVGNKWFTKILHILCGVETSDIFSGLRIMSKGFINSFPMVSSEFEVEAELSVFASRMKFPTKDFPTGVISREGTISKLNTYKDGAKILYFIFKLLHREFPLRIYMPLSIILSSISILFIFGVLVEFMETGLVERLPTLLVSCFGLLSGIFTLGMGLILKELVNTKYEGRYIAYLASKRS